MSLTLSVFIQAMPGRPSMEKTLESIAKSDLPTPIIVTQPPTLEPAQFFRSLLRQMSEAKTDLVLRLEDDVLVNRHMAHNVVTWPALEDKRFGLGWVFDPGGTARTIIDFMYGRVPLDRWHEGELHCCQGVVAWTRDMPQLLSFVEEYGAAHPGPIFDWALSWAVQQMKLRICVHSPSLVEHQSVPSTLGHDTHPIYNTSNGTFDEHWKRGEVCTPPEK